VRGLRKRVTSIIQSPPYVAAGAVSRSVRRTGSDFNFTPFSRAFSGPSLVQTFSAPCLEKLASYRLSNHPQFFVRRRCPYHKMSEMFTTTDNDNSDPKLPFDVFHYIVDILAYLDDIDTLKAFSMVRCAVSFGQYVQSIYMRPLTPEIGLVGTVTLNSKPF
jgi:hypothetical protein